MVYTLRFFPSSKWSFFLNSNVFGSCIINILYIYSTNIGTEYFKHGIYSPFFPPFQNGVCFLILTYLVPVLFTFYIQDVLNLKNNSGAKRLRGSQVFLQNFNKFHTRHHGVMYSLNTVRKTRLMFGYSMVFFSPIRLLSAAGCPIWPYFNHSRYSGLNLFWRFRVRICHWLTVSSRVPDMTLL